MIRRLAFTLGLVVFTTVAFSQGRISGTVIDLDANEPIPFANVVVFANGVQKGITQTDFDGKYAISPLDAGKYNVVTSYLGEKKEIEGVVVNSNKTTRLNIEFSSAVKMDEVVVFAEKIVEVDKTSTGAEITAEDIQNAPTRNVATLVGQQGSVTSTGDGGNLNIGGSRSENNLIMVNGVKINSNTIPNLPMAAIKELQLITGGVPAQYGDLTGGVININTKEGAEKVVGSIEMETGTPFNAYNYNLISGTVSGPLKTRTRIDEFDDGNGNMIKDTVKETVVGYFVSGQVQGIKDPRPTIIKDRNGDFQTGVYAIKEDTLAYIQENPLIRSGNGYIYSAEALDFNDLEISKARQNVGRNSAQVNATFNYYPNENMTFSLGGNLNYRKYHEYIPGYSLMNFSNNPLRNVYDYNIWGRFRQSFGNTSSDDSSAALIKNAFYQIQFDYAKLKATREDDTHGKNFFRYGHVGQFATASEYQRALTAEEFAAGGNSNYQMIYNDSTDMNEVYSIGGDSIAAFSSDIEDINVTSSTGGFFDDYTFTESEYNPLAARYISHYQELEGSSTVNFIDLFQDGLFINGGRARIVHDLWYGPGREYGGYEEFAEEQYRLSGKAGADVGNHSIEFGFEYEQRVRSQYNVNDAVGLWFLAFGNVNTHLGGFDYDNATITEDAANGTAYVDVRPGIANINDQTTFDKNLRAKLNLDDDEVINIWEVNADDLTLDMFEANDLIQFQNANWIGYDHTGKRDRTNYEFTDFFTDTINRPQSAFKPIYTAFYIQDKFEINDLILRIGVRVDRYDANQVVLKDRYSTVYLDKVNETDLYKFTNWEQGDELPELVEDDWTIYVDKPSDDLTEDNISEYTVVGFRDGDNWYDSEGNRVRDYAYIVSTNDDAPGNAEPFFTYGNDPGRSDLEKDLFDSRQLDIYGAFEDFKAQINVMPRISFSFPVNDMATFFANYDVLTKRPDANRTRIRPADYYLMTQLSFINNPDLKPKRTINYQLGFKQALDKKQTVAMTLSAAYTEFKNEVQYTSVQNAYPGSYETFANVDFGTVKRGEVSFDTRRINNFKINANYTISFAEGTGSSTTTAVNLIRQGLGNIKFPTPLDYDRRHAVKATLDYRLDSGQGPTLLGRKLLQGFGGYVQFVTLSGAPYTKFATSNTSELFITAAGRTQLDAGINTSRLPWETNFNLRVYKYFDIRGRKDALNVYLYVQNLLNQKNVINVYKNTGSPDDDGFMYVRNDINQISDAEAAMYFARLTTPDWGGSSPYSNYSMPRRIRLGVAYFF